MYTCMILCMESKAISIHNSDAKSITMLVSLVQLSLSRGPYWNAIAPHRNSCSKNIDCMHAICVYGLFITIWVPIVECNCAIQGCSIMCYGCYYRRV